MRKGEEDVLLSGVEKGGDHVKEGANPVGENPLIVKEKDYASSEELPMNRNLILSMEREGGEHIEVTPVSEFERLYSDLCLLNLSLDEIGEKY